MNNCPYCGQELTNNVDESDVDAVMSFKLSTLEPGAKIPLGMYRNYYREQLKKGSTVELLKLEIDGISDL